MLLGNRLAGWSVLPVFAAKYVLLRSPREERLMGESFGEEYRVPRVRAEDRPAVSAHEDTGLSQIHVLVTPASRSG